MSRAHKLVGVVRVRARTFALWRAIDGMVWMVSLTLGGYALEAGIPSADRLLLLVAAVIAVPLFPPARETPRARRRPRTVTEPTQDASA